VAHPLSANKVRLLRTYITPAYRYDLPPFLMFTAIQLAKLSGFSPIITTASLHNESLLLSLGATHVFDRRLSNAALIKRVRALVTVPVTYIFDAVAVKETQQAAYALLAPGGTLVVVEKPQVGGDDDGSQKKVFMVIGSFHPLPNRALGAKFAIAMTAWLEEGKIKVRV
jgi:NADPH:quinone reductase-like Zn-dependent oxidoreductase